MLRRIRTIRRAVGCGIAVVLASLAGASGSLAATQVEPSRSTLVRLTDRGIASYGDFWTNLWPKRNARPHSWLDWTSDLCGDAPEPPEGVSFARACRRRDFGIANACGLQAMNSARTFRIERSFRRDLQRVCPAVRLVCTKAVDDAIRVATQGPTCP